MLGVYIPPAFVFECLVVQPAFARHQAMRDPHQIQIVEHHARPFFAIVVQDLDTGRQQLGIQPLDHLTQASRALDIDRRERYLERCDRLRPDDAAFIVILLDCRGHDPRYTNTIAPHDQGHRLAVFVRQVAFIVRLYLSPS